MEKGPGMRCTSLSVPFFLVTLKDILDTRFPVAWDASDLTRREVEIAKCVCQGLSNKDIGDISYISENTVESHLKNIFRKTGIRNRASLHNLMDYHRQPSELATIL